MCVCVQICEVTGLVMCVHAYARVFRAGGLLGINVLGAFLMSVG